MSACKLLRALLPISGALSVHQGALKVNMDGSVVKLHVVALSDRSEELFTTSGEKLKMKWGNQTRGFLASEESDDMEQNNYFNFTLFNRELSYDVDLRKVGCSCNAALFFVSMPGFNEDGTMAKGDYNPWYCDANKVGGVWCWEHDTIESNMYALATTPHRCNAAPGGYIAQCDGVGCASSTFRADPKGFCPDSSCTIDTRKPFRIIQRFEADSSMTKLRKIRNRLAQGNRTFDWEACAQPEYLEQMTAAFKGNWTMTFQLWGDDYSTMSWLDEATGCTGDCATGETETTFSNIAIKTLGGEAEEDSVMVI